MLHKRGINLFFYIFLTLSSQAGCLLLFRLSQFGQNPLPQLPIIVVLYFGALFVAPLLGLGRGSRPRRRLLTLCTALAANVGLTLLLRDMVPGASLYLLAPLTAIILAELYPLLFKKHAPLLAAMTVYIVCTLLANYTFDSFLPLPVYGLVNVGTLFFGVTFTQRDHVHQYGRRYAYMMIFVAALLNVVNALFLGTPLRYVAVGFAAILLSETADTEVYQRFIRKSWLTRVATSNAVSIPIDTLVFTIFAFAGEVFATPAWLTEVVLTDILVKLVVGFVTALGILGVRGKAASSEVSLDAAS
ncbi:hypothetical protein BH24DEI2_BH24DEI2_21020 [soil metagenome]